MPEFGRTLIVDQDQSTFLRKAETQFRPHCAHYEIATDFEGIQRKLEGEAPFDMVMVDYALTLLGSWDPGSTLPRYLPPWAGQLDKGGKLKLLQQLEEAWPGAVVVLMTDYSLEASVPEGTMLGAHGFIDKNWQWERIMERLGQICALVD
jgi:DNA-binding NarL/FixJ family response regulator